MNDSPYGLTSSIWTTSESDFLELVDSLETGTVFQNRCDYLDPALAWTGVKHSGRGVSLGKFGKLCSKKLFGLAAHLFLYRL